MAEHNETVSVMRSAVADTKKGRGSALFECDKHFASK